MSSQDLINCPHCPGKYKRRGLTNHIRSAHKNVLHNDSSNGSPVSSKSSSTFTDKISELKRNIPRLKRIPKGARNVTAEKLSKQILNCVNSNTVDAWKKLLVFSYECLRVPEKQGSRSLTNLVKDNVLSQKLPDVKNKKKKELTLTQRVEKKIEDFNTKGALRIITSNDTVAPVNDENYEKLLAMHPVPSRDIELPEPPNETSIYLQVTEKMVTNAIQSFPNGSSAGFDGISPQHLKDLISKSAGDQGENLLKSIVKLVNLMLHGKVCEDIIEYLYGANLCALNKKDGGFRPIAVGCTFRRLCGKICCAVYQEKCMNYFQPFQLGFGTKQGCESIIHATRTFIDENKESNSILVKIDYKNAFNCIERDILLKEVQKHTPELYPFLWQCYSSPSMLLFGNKSIRSQVGCQQGDPTSTLTFSLAIHFIVLMLKSKLKLFYLDDGTLAGDPETVIEDIDVLLRESKKIGLTINPAKCELHFISNILNNDIQKQFENVLPGIRIVSSADLTLLGSPLCSEGFQTTLEEKSESLNLMIERLKLLPKQVAYFLLKNCLGIPKLLFTLRTVPTFLLPEKLSSMDAILQSSLKAILNLDINDIQWKQASLPVKQGGIGIRSLSDLSLPTFLSSCSGVMPLVSIILNKPVDNVVINSCSQGMQMWEVKYNEIPELKNQQRKWDDIVIKNKIQQEMIFENTIDVARMKSLQNNESGAWLNVYPSKNIGTLMNDQSFQMCIGQRLGCDICRKFTCKCGQTVDEKGLHPLSCEKSSGRYFRHAEVNNILKRALCSIDIPAQLEPTGLDRNDGKRPDGATIIPWRLGQSLVWDFTCTDTFAPSYINQTCKNAGAAAQMAVQRKHSKYSMIKSRGVELVVLAVETMGVWCDEGKKWIQEIGKKMIEKTGNTESMSHLIAKISMTIQRGNAASVLGALPSEELTSMFYL